MKSQRAYQFLVVFLLILPARIFSQQQMPLFAQKTPHLLKSFGNFKATRNQNNSYPYSRFIYNEVPRPFILSPLEFTMEAVNTNFAIQNLPFFCKKEFQFEKNTSVPLRVRLGSLDYVNKLEGKDNHWSMGPGN